jgi:hypothetical protein
LTAEKFGSFCTKFNEYAPTEPLGVPAQGRLAARLGRFAIRPGLTLIISVG